MLSLVQAITPTNLEEEKLAFFKSRTYHPQFSYPWVANPETQFSRHPLVREAIICQKGIVELASNLFQVAIDEKILQKAKSVIISNRKRLERQNDYDEFIDYFESTLKILGINYDIEQVNYGGFFVRPLHGKKKVLISNEISFKFFNPIGSARHEIVHILRGVNTKHNGISYSKGFLGFEEGLASYVQDYLSPEGDSSIIQHAAEYIATDIALKGNLRDVFNFFKELDFDDNTAWNRSVRHKYGFIDTSKPGDIMKPAAYFYHEQKVADLSRDQIINSFVGKIRIDELVNYSSYEGSVQEVLLKEFLFNPEFMKKN